MSQIEISTCYNISRNIDEPVKLSIYISVHNMDNNTIRLKGTMALGQKRKVHHGALKYERETEYKVQEITISAKEHTSKNNLTPQHDTLAC